MWIEGRQGTNYRKKKIFEFGSLFDCWLLKYKEGSYTPEHTDIVPGRKHYRLNIVLKNSEIGGEFKCDKTLFSLLNKIYLFRSDQHIHSVSKVIKGNRYVLSIGFTTK